MSTGFVYNGFGKYEKRDGEIGIALKYAGMDFWLPYQKVTAIPNWTFREVDHDKTTPNGDVEGQLVYMSVVVSGQRVVEELCNKQIPVSHAKMGITPIKGVVTGQNITVGAGCDADGNILTAEIPERQATKSEIAEADANAEAFKQEIIANYFQSKRERMTGGHGRNTPDERTRIYMNELNVEDLDDVTAHQRANVAGIDPILLEMILNKAMKATTEIAVEAIDGKIDSIRKARKTQLTRTQPVAEKLAENKARFDALPPEEQARRLAAGARLKAAREAKRLVNS